MNLSSWKKHLQKYAFDDSDGGKISRFQSRQINQSNQSIKYLLTPHKQHYIQRILINLISLRHKDIRIATERQGQPKKL